MEAYWKMGPTLLVPLHVSLDASHLFMALPTKQPKSFGEMQTRVSKSHISVKNADALGMEQNGYNQTIRKRNRLITCKTYKNIKTMVSLFTLIGGYYILSGQASKAIAETTKWIDEKTKQSKDNK